MDYLFLSEQEMLEQNLGSKEKVLWTAVQQITKGEDPSSVTKTALRSGLLTKKDFVSLGRWLKKNRPPREKRSIDRFRKRGSC